jgi:RecB family exonuclease
LDEAVNSLIDECRRPDQPLADWAAVLERLITSVHGSGKTLDDPAHGILLDILRDAGRADRSKPVSAAAAIQLVLEEAADRKLPSFAEGPLVEVGWPEVVYSDAECVAIAGFNDGRLPPFQNVDAFLPNGLRARLGLLDNDKRSAEDAYRLTLLLSSGVEVRLISGKRTAAGDPLAPSRLLFACEPSQLAKRVLAFYGRREGKGAPGDDTGPADLTFPLPPPPDRTAESLSTLSVTGFRDYLACPYRFYLRHVLKLERIEPARDELDAGAFGSFAHEILEDLASPHLGSATDARMLARHFSERLNELADLHFGSAPPPAVTVQKEQLRSRLARLAEWQANWAAQGWMVVEIEKPMKGDVGRFDVDGRPFNLRARIDRIDRNERTGEWCILDYKTSDSAKSPRQYHNPWDVWEDLQLPLYWHLLQPAAEGKKVRLGYVLLVKDLSKIGLLEADWSQWEINQAIETAREVVRKIRDQVFWPPTSPAPKYFKEFAAVCRDDVLRLPSEGEEEDE